MSLKFWSLRMGWYSSELVNPNGVAVTTCNTMPKPVLTAGQRRMLNKEFP